MLQFIRGNAGSWIVKVLLSILVISFAIWGVGDVFRTDPNEIVVAEVGNQKIRVGEVRHDLFKQINQLSQLMGGQFDIEQAKKMGIEKSLVDELVNRAMLQKFYGEMGLEVGEEQIRQELMGRKQFYDEKGAFDAGRFQTFLRMMHMSEGELIARYRSDLRRNLVNSAAFEDAHLPNVLKEILYRYNEETRIADYVSFEASSQKVEAPEEKALQDFYKKNEKLYKTPEYRNVSALLLDPKVKAKSMGVSDADLKKAYDDRLDEYTKPEKRDAEELVFKTKEEALAAKAQIAQGKTFEALQKELGDKVMARFWGMTPVADLGEEMAAAVLKLKKDELSEPFQTSEGYHLVRVKAIEEGSVKSFDAVKAALQEALQTERATDEIINNLNDYEDLLNQNKTLEQVAEKAKVTVQKIEALSKEGKTKAGSESGLPMDAVKNAFNLGTGDHSGFQETEGGVYYLVKVDQIIDPVLKPFDSVKDAVIKAVNEKAQNDAAQKLAQDMVSQMDKGKSLAELASSSGLKVETSKPFNRVAAVQKLPHGLITALFDKKIGGAAQAHKDKTYYVAALKSVHVPVAFEDKGRTEKMTTDTTRVMTDDLEKTFLEDLKKRYGVKINKDAFEHLFQN